MLQQQFVCNSGKKKTIAKALKAAGWLEHLHSFAVVLGAVLGTNKPGHVDKEESSVIKDRDRVINQFKQTGLE